MEPPPQIIVNGALLSADEAQSVNSVPEGEEDAALTMFPMPNGPQRVSSVTTSAEESPPAEKAVRQKVVLPPGHSHMDWVRLKSSGKNLRGVNEIGRYTYSDIRKHNKPDDCWIALKGRVYNVTAYLDFHPGGRRQVLAVAGKDATRLFDATHAWVNIDFLLRECMVGFLVPE